MEPNPYEAPREANKPLPAGQRARRTWAIVVVDWIVILLVLIGTAMPGIFAAGYKS